MFKLIVLSQSKNRMSNIILISICFIICFLSAYNLNSQDAGGFTDPKTPGRHSRLNIDSANIVVLPHGIYAEVTTEFWYRSVDLTASTDTLEMYAGLTLPATDFMNDSWLWVNDTLVNAEIIDVNAASLIYEEIVHRLHKDPSILYRRNTTGYYEYRIYPNVGNQNRHAKLSYYTKMIYANGNAQFTFTPTILNLSVNKSFPRNFKFYFNKNFTDIDFGASPPVTNYSSDIYGKYVEFNTVYTTLKQTFSYQYDFSVPYFSKSQKIDDQEYYFTMFDSKLLISNYINQKINFLIDYDFNRTTISAKDVIDQLKKVILTNFTSNDSINIMIGNKNTINLFNRWVPCSKDTINFLLDSTIYTKIGFYSYLPDLLADGINFNEKFDNNSSIVLLTSSEYAPTPVSANPIIENCLQLMGQHICKITSVDFSDVHYSTYNINSTNYYGDQYFNEKIAELTKSDFYSIKGNNSSVFSMLNTAFSLLKGTISDIGLYIDPKDGITISKTSENLIDKNSNNKLIYEYGKIVGGYPIVAKFSALLDGKPVVHSYIIDSSNVIINNESAKMWNWPYLRSLEDKYNKTKKEIYDLTNRSISNRILTIQTAFLCLEPWMMKKDTIANETPTTSVQEDIADIGLEMAYGPNPVENNLFVKINIKNENTKIFNIGIYDVMGRVVKEFNIDGLADNIELYWDVYSDSHEKVLPGVYYLVIKTNSGSKILKLVII